jgi:CubicO group peptidase (beta-lactamase class C family)
VRILSEQSVDAMLAPHISALDLGFQPIPFGFGFALGDAASDANGSLPAGTASWAGSANTFFWIHRRSRTVALFMTHVLTMPDRMLHFRQIFNRTARAFLVE